MTFLEAVCNLNILYEDVNDRVHITSNLYGGEAQYVHSEYFFITLIFYYLVRIYLNEHKNFTEIWFIQPN